MAVDTEVTYSFYLANSLFIYQALTVFEHETSITGMPRKSRASTPLRQCKLMSHFALAGHCAAEDIFQTKHNINHILIILG